MDNRTAILKAVKTISYITKIDIRKLLEFIDKEIKERQR